VTCHSVPGVGIVCSGRGRSFRCQVIGCTRPATALCDHELGGGTKQRTCSARLCDEHRHRAGADRDLCPFHAPAQTAPRQGDLFGGGRR
jgi:hypothetical protein